VVTIKNINPQICIGLIVIDAHGDLYDTNQAPWKGNVVSSLLLDGCVEFAIILGIPAKRQQVILADIPQEILRRVLMLEPNPSLDQIHTALRMLISWGITNVFFSIDPDGFNTRSAKMTAMEYCPFQILINLAEIDLYNLRREEAESKLKSVIMPQNSIQGGYKNLLGIGDRGIEIQQLRLILDYCFSFLKQNKIEVGAEGCVGDVVELFGPDIGLNTAKVVSETIEILLNGAS